MVNGGELSFKYPHTTTSNNQLATDRGHTTVNGGELYSRLPTKDQSSEATNADPRSGESRNAYLVTLYIRPFPLIVEPPFMASSR